MEVIQIKLSRGRHAAIDCSDFPLVDGIVWSLSSGGYASGTDKHGTKVYMHRLIAGAAGGVHVDHANRNKLDNRRSNLRLCTQQQNSCNSKLSNRNTSGFKGVARHHTGKWRAFVSCNKRQINCGLFSTKEEAAEARNKMAVSLYGEFAEESNLVTPATGIVVRPKAKAACGYRGVSWCRKTSQWYARISTNGKTVYLGFFSKPDDAARAYDDAARRIYGSGARTNFA